MSSIYGNMIGGTAPIKTIIIEDESGATLTGVVVDNEVVFTANAATDIREGKIAATSEGVVTGQKVIPSYHTAHGSKLIAAGQEMKIYLPDLDRYDYTVLHCVVCSFNTSLSNSVAAEKISVLNQVYPVQSTEALSTVTKDHDGKNIVLGITNDSDKPCVLRYMTYKEID